MVVIAALVLVAASVVAITSVFGAQPTPTPNITSGPANPTNVTSASFTFTDSAPAATFECSLDSGAFAACVSPKSYPGPLAIGAHIFSVRAQKSGASVSSPASLSWRVDTVAPSLLSINRAGANPASVGPLAWTATFAEPVSGLTLSNLGLVTSGLSGSAPSLLSVAPVGAAPSATWTVKAATTGTTAVNGTIGLNLTSKAPVKDAAGNSLGGSVPVVGQAYGYDTTKPTLTSLNRADATPAKSGPLHWTATFSEAVNNVVGSNFGVSTSGFTGSAPSIASVLPVGSAPASSWTVTVATSGATAVHGTIRLDLTAKGTLQDAAGNPLLTTVPAAGQAYDYDSVAPAVTLTNVNGATASFPLSTGANVTSFSGTCGRAVGDSASVYVSITGSAIQSAVVPCTASATWSYSTSPVISSAGTYRVTATQPDTAGNTGSSGEKTVVIDRTPPPKPVFTNTPDASTDKTNAQFNWSDTEAGVHYQCSLDGAGLTPCSSSGLELKNLSIGMHCFAVVALDPVGNASAPTTFCWTVTTSAGFTISGGANQPLYPGAAPQSLDVSISNSNNFAIKVTTLTVTIQSETLNGSCSTGPNFTVVHSLLVPAVIPAHSTKKLSEVGVAASDRPQIRMLETNLNQNSCKNVVLHLNYTGSAEKA